MLNNTNISKVIVLTNVFADDFWWSSSTTLIRKNYFRLDKLTIVIKKNGL